MKEAVAGVVGVLMLTTLVLPGRQTPAILDKGFTGLSKFTKSVLGQG